MIKLSVHAASPDLFRSVRAELRSGRLPDLGHSERADRVAVLGLIIATLFCAWWLIFAGMSVWAAVIFLVLSMILYIGATRVICEGGIIFVQACMIPQTTQRTTSFHWLSP